MEWGCLQDLSGSGYESLTDSCGHGIKSLRPLKEELLTGKATVRMKVPPQYTFEPNDHAIEREI
jgi:hypothetical protein